MRANSWRGRFLFFAILIGVGRLGAHDPGISLAQGRLSRDAILLTIGFAPADVEQLLPADARARGRWTPEYFKSVEVLLQSLAPQLWSAQLDGAPVRPADVRVELTPDDNVSFYLLFQLPPGAQALTLRALKLADLPAGHREYVLINDDRGATVVKQLLTAANNTLVVPVPGTAAAAVGTSAAAQSQRSSTTFWGFLRLGVEHIWTGYDHLLFLFGLLVVCRSFRSIVAIISCFTVAHSLTLALATLNVVTLPSRLVEPAIAASIVFVGVENLARRGAEPRGRWALTFAFGLVHGFGFASVLRELGVGANGQSIAVPLFTFNAGVEIGQIAIAALVLPLVWQLRKLDWFVRRGVPVLSTIVAAAGLYWFLQRTVWN